VFIVYGASKFFCNNPLDLFHMDNFTFQFMVYNQVSKYLFEHQDEENLIKVKDINEYSETYYISESFYIGFQDKEKVNMLILRIGLKDLIEKVKSLKIGLISLVIKLMVIVLAIRRNMFLFVFDFISSSVVNKFFLNMVFIQPRIYSYFGFFSIGNFYRLSLGAIQNCSKQNINKEFNGLYLLYFYRENLLTYGFYCILSKKFQHFSLYGFYDQLAIIFFRFSQSDSGKYARVCFFFNFLDLFIKTNDFKITLFILLTTKKKFKIAIVILLFYISINIGIIKKSGRFIPFFSVGISGSIDFVEITSAFKESQDKLISL